AKSKATKQISKLLAERRARAVESNRAEFLRPPPAPNDSADAMVEDVASCARTDARKQDRDIQMKYDIAKNEDGPLRKTMDHSVGHSTSNASHTGKHPALRERFENIESHLAVKHVPAPPYSLLDRIKLVEDRIIQLEKEYPPWAALHFCQPNRGWPPPP
ncbi:hypothetical protein SISSUDRAFT_955613, partial [Sistotremastrum suecicum HHB10207 ss-3]